MTEGEIKLLVLFFAAAISVPALVLLSIAYLNQKQTLKDAKCWYDSQSVKIQELNDACLNKSGRIERMARDYEELLARSSRFVSDASLAENALAVIAQHIEVYQAAKKLLEPTSE